MWCFCALCLFVLVVRSLIASVWLTFLTFLTVTYSLHSHSAPWCFQPKEVSMRHQTAFYWSMSKYYSLFSLPCNSSSHSDTFPHSFSPCFAMTLPSSQGFGVKFSHLRLALQHLFYPLDEISRKRARVEIHTLLCLSFQVNVTLHSLVQNSM